MDKKILKVRSPFRALFYSIFLGSTDDFSEQTSKINTKKWLFNNKLTTKYRILLYILKVVLSMGLIGLAFACIGASIGRAKLSPRDMLSSINILIFSFTWFFCFVSSMSTLFMSHDVLFFMTLPVKESSLTRAKLIQAVLFNAYFDIAIICLFFSASITGNYSLRFIISGFIFVVSSCIFSKIIMLFLMFWGLNKTRKIVNKDRFIKYFSSVLMILTFLISFIFNGIGASKPLLLATAYTNFLYSLPGLIITNILNIFTVSGLFLPLFLLPQKLYSYLFLLVLVLTLVTVVYLAGKYMSAKYLVILSNLQNHSTSNVAPKSTLQLSFKVQSPRRSFAYIDKLLVKRTPNLFTNFVLAPIVMNTFFLVIFAAPIIFNQKEHNIHILIEQAKLYVSSNVSSNWYTTYAVLIVMAVITAVMGLSFFTSPTSSEIMRDGRNFIFYRSLPLKMKDYLKVKFKRAFLYTCAIYETIIIVLILLAVSFVKLPIMMAVMLIVYSLSLAISLCVSELIIGAVFASFNFDLDTEILRQLKSFSRMILNLAASLVIILPLIGLFYIGFNFPNLRQITYIPIIATVWQFLLTVVLLGGYFGPFAKYLGTKSLS